MLYTCVFSLLNIACSRHAFEIHNLTTLKIAWGILGLFVWVPFLNKLHFYLALHLSIQFLYVIIFIITSSVLQSPIPMSVLNKDFFFKQNCQDLCLQETSFSCHLSFVKCPYHMDDKIIQEKFWNVLCIFH